MKDQETVGGARGWLGVRSVLVMEAASVTLNAKGCSRGIHSGAQYELSATLPAEEHSGQPSEAARLAPLWSGMLEAVPGMRSPCSTQLSSEAWARLAAMAWLLCMQQITALNSTHQPNSTASQARLPRLAVLLLIGLESDEKSTR